MMCKLHLKISISLLFLITIFGCSSNKNYNSAKLKAKKIIRFQSFKNEPLNIFNIFYAEDSRTKNRFLIARDKEYTNLILYQFKDLKPVFRIPIKQFKTLWGLGFYCHNTDSVFIQENQTNTIYLTNIKGEIINKWIINKSFEGLNKYEINAGPVNPIFYLDGKIYTSLSTYRSWQKNKPENFNFNTKLIIDLSKDTLNTNNNSGHFPEIYNDEKIYRKRFEDPSSVLNEKSQLVTSFPLDHYLYVYENESEVGKYLVKSISLDSFAHFDVNRSYLNDYDEISYNSYGRYYNLLYDKWRKIYYRIVLPHNKYYNDDGSKNNYERRPFNIMILNKNFEVLKEVGFTGDKFIFGNILVVKEGLLISINNTKNPLYKDDYYSYQLFKVKLK